MFCYLNDARHGIVHSIVSGCALKLELQPPLVFGNDLHIVILLLLDVEGVPFNVPDGHHEEVVHLFLDGGEILRPGTPQEALGNIGQV